MDDREWIAADGANKVCVSYHAYATTNNLFVTCSYDGGTTFAQVANAFDANHPWHAPYQNEIGNLAINPNNHLIYQSFSSIANAGEVSCLSCSTHAVWIAVSIDGGLSFTDYPVLHQSQHCRRIRTPVRQRQRRPGGQRLPRLH